MKVGFTYDLRDDYLKEGFNEEETAEFDRPSTIDAVQKALESIGHKVDRIGHARSLVARLAKGDRWGIVFNIAEGMYGIGREAQVPAILDTYNIPYTFSDPLVSSLTLHKGMTKRVVRDLGVPTPDFVVVESEADAKQCDLPFPVFAKPVAEGTGKGIDAASKIKNKADLVQVCARLLKKYNQTVLVETFLPGAEYTVSLVGTGDDARCIGSLLVELLANAEAEAYSYVNKEKCEELVRYTLVRDEGARKCEDYALKTWRGLGLRDAGRIDFRMDSAGVPNFMEVNPLAGIHPEHSDLPITCNQAGIPYNDLMAMIMSSALSRTASPDAASHRSKLIELQTKHGLREKPS